MIGAENEEIFCVFMINKNEITYHHNKLYHEQHKYIIIYDISMS